MPETRAVRIGLWGGQDRPALGKLDGQPYCPYCWEIVKPAAELCAGCGRLPALLTTRHDGLRRCRHCRSVRPGPCARCGIAAKAERHWPEGQVCLSCVDTVRFTHATCTTCQQHRPVFRRDADDNPIWLSTLLRGDGACRLAEGVRSSRRITPGNGCRRRREARTRHGASWHRATGQADSVRPPCAGRDGQGPYGGVLYARRCSPPTPMALLFRLRDGDNDRQLGSDLTWRACEC